MAQDSFTETTTRSYGSRLGESLKGILFGVALLIGATVLLWWNEGRTVERTETLSAGLAATLSLPEPVFDPQNNGKPIHISGALHGGALFDPLFGVHAQGILLKRDVAMYQWREEVSEETKQELGGKETTTKTYRYETTWSSTHINSAGFRQSAEHTNPSFPYSDDQFGATATIGDFTLAPELLDEADGWRDFLPQSIETATAATLQGDALYIGADPSAPQVGDLRISYTIIPDGPFSIVADQGAQKNLGYHTLPNGNDIGFVVSGNHSAEAIFAQAEHENTLLAWGLRALGLFLMFSGFLLIMGPIATLASVVPFLGNLVGTGTALVSAILTLIFGGGIIVIAWFMYRPWLTGILLLLVAGLIYWARTRAKTDETAQPQWKRTPPQSQPE
ncbi:MAG: TMEM43 family protein [Campylobacterales bacterium]|nr:TMEM43 family protein [Campylobacterales bacterium]